MTLRMIHVITGLQTGGAETMLAKLVTHRASSPFDPIVVSLSGDGPLAAVIRAAGVPVTALGMRPGAPDPRVLARLTMLLRRERPEVVQTWLYHADLLGGLAARAAGGIPVAWGLHQSNLSPEFNKRGTLLTARACACLSRTLPTAIVCCADAARTAHVAFGYAAERMTVIPNGFDLTAFRPDPDAGAVVRSALGLPASSRLVGHVARWDPQKDHETFVTMGGLLLRERPDVHLVLCGTNIDGENRELTGWIEREGIGDRCHLLGRRTDVASLLPGFDLVCSSSRGEAFPLAVGEAMACGVPCAVTDVGDSAVIVGDTGAVGPPRDPASLAAACARLLDLPEEARRGLGLRARARIAENYALPLVAGRYASLWTGLAESRRGALPCAA